MTFRVTILSLNTGCRLKILEHLWSVKGPPTTRTTSCCGFWAIGETPTGSKDPVALRRAALGVIRQILENKLRLPLADCLEQALANQHCGLDPAARPGLVQDLLQFFAERLKVALKEQGVRHDLITAVFALEKPEGGAEDDGQADHCQKGNRQVNVLVHHRLEHQRARRG